MIFESLWPLFFLAAVPIIIILYLLKPKGIDYLISSNLLWQKLLRNEQSRTFLEKFVHNILMYLQLLIIALLVIALMSPFIKVEGRNGGRTILLLDTSASMQHRCMQHRYMQHRYMQHNRTYSNNTQNTNAQQAGSTEKSRLEEAVDQACEYVKTAEHMQFSIVTVDGNGVQLLAVDSTDTDSLVQTLKGLECSDSGGTIVQAQGILDTLIGDSAEQAANLVVYTDGSGASGFEELHSTAQKELYVIGEAVSNVANEYTVFTEREDGFYDVMVSVANYSDKMASFDISLYDEGEKVIALAQMQLAPSESTFHVFEQVNWRGKTLTSRIDGITFSDSSQEGSQSQGISHRQDSNSIQDSLAADNCSQAVKGRQNRINGLLVGSGNTFLEKAYFAVTGESLAKAKTDAAAQIDTGTLKRTPLQEEGYNVVIYDAGQAPQNIETSRLLFGDARGEAVETLENVVLDITDCDLTAGLSGFHIGVNKAYCFALPQGAQSFLAYNGKCVGYYGEWDGRKEIVVGFDIRESDFPLRAEFPVFLANAMIYLSDTSWLAASTYYAGEEIALQPWAELDRTQFDSRPKKAGVYQIGNDEYQERYVVRFRTDTESEGRTTAKSVVGTHGLQVQKVKQTLRNLFLLLALVLLVVEWMLYVRQMRYRGKFYLAVRGVVVLCVLLALLGIKIRLGSAKTATVFIVDLSSSNETHLEEMQDYLQKSIAKMPSGNVFGIVTFGKNTMVEQFLSDQKQYGGLMTLPEKTATNFEDAVSKALTLMSGEYAKRLVVLTDGKETRGNIQNMAHALSISQAEFLTLLYENEVTDDAYIDNVILPTYLHPKDKYAITVLVESNYNTDAVIGLYRGSMQLAENDVHLNKGSNRFVFRAQVDEKAGSGSMEGLRVEVEAQGDTCAENNVFNAYSIVEAPPKILVISGGNADISAFSSVLKAAGCNYSVVSALNAPKNIETMLEYKSIILVDTYIDDLPNGFLGNLETYIKDYGCGFICCGGDNSFALGGYRDSVLETVLPVDMQLISVNESPSMAMVMVIDRSGSMAFTEENASITNLDVAVRAAEVAVDNLRNTDSVGVLTFDDEYHWQVKLQQVQDRAVIKEEIKKIDEGGGTRILPSLEAACDALAESNASVKHVVLLTDGMGETDNFSRVIDAYTKNGITLSTVAVGSESDKDLLRLLAQECGGRYYYSDSSSDIPRIFAQEVFMGGDSYIQNGTFSLAVQANHVLTSDLFPDGWPALYGYIAATPKTASNPVIKDIGKGNPILTIWQYGLGRTAAWNSDVTGEWSSAFAGQEDYVQLWKRIVDYTSGSAKQGEDSVNVVTVGEHTEVAYQAQDFDGSTEVYVTTIDPKGNSAQQKLHATAPGIYTTDVSTPLTGLYHFHIQRSDNGILQNDMKTATAVQFSDEYKFNVNTTSYLNFAKQYGRVITADDSIWGRIRTSTQDRIPLTNLLLVLGICIFLADVAMRRLQYQPIWANPALTRHKKTAKGGNQQSEVKMETAAEDNWQAGAKTESTMINSQQAPRAASDMQKNAANAGNIADVKTMESVQDVSVKIQTKKQKKESARKTKKQAEQTLNTSQLLKKKEERKG